VPPWPRSRGLTASAARRDRAARPAGGLERRAAFAARRAELVVPAALQPRPPAGQAVPPRPRAPRRVVGREGE
jgi:hypothetical protein